MRGLVAVLSFTLPIPIITLIAFTRNREIMGKMVNSRLVTALATACAAVILFLKSCYSTRPLAGPCPFLAEAVLDSWRSP